MLQRVKFECGSPGSKTHTEKYETFVYHLLQRMLQTTYHFRKVRVKRVRCSAELFQSIVAANSSHPIIRVEKFSRPVHGKIGRLCGVLVYETPGANHVEVEYTKIAEEQEGVPDTIYSTLMDSGFSY